MSSYSEMCFVMLNHLTWKSNNQVNKFTMAFILEE